MKINVNGAWIMIIPLVVTNAFAGIFLTFPARQGLFLLNVFTCVMIALSSRAE